jgi:hypothetical protein
MGIGDYWFVTCEPPQIPLVPEPPQLHQIPQPAAGERAMQ